MRGGCSWPPLPGSLCGQHTCTLPTNIQDTLRKDMMSIQTKSSPHTKKNQTHTSYARTLPHINSPAREESEKAGFKLNIEKTKIVESGPTTSWQIDGETMETVTDFILEGSKITTNGDCSHEIKRCLRLGRKTMPNLNSMLKRRNITLLTKVCLAKAMVFPVVMYWM